MCFVWEIHPIFSVQNENLTGLLRHPFCINISVKISLLDSYPALDQSKLAKIAL